MNNCKTLKDMWWVYFNRCTPQEIYNNLQKVAKSWINDLEKEQAHINMNDEYYEYLEGQIAALYYYFDLKENSE